MLLNLHVKNLALIAETEIDFGPNLNILTGETGAGKSIIIGSINLALGAKADKDMIRHGADYALVELTFQIDKQEQTDQLKALDFYPEEDGTLVLSRKIMENRSVSKVNGETVTAKQLKQLASILIDIHGQQEHQSLVDKKKQLYIVDRFAPAKLAEIKEAYQKQYKEFLALDRELSELSEDLAGKKREIDLAAYEVEEIEKASLKIGEDAQLEAAYRKMVNGQKLCQSLAQIQSDCGYEEMGAGTMISHAVREMRQIVNLDEGLIPIENTLLDLESILSDLSREVSDYLEDCNFEQTVFEETEERLNQINRLKDKYGKTIEDIIAYQEKQQAFLDKYQDIDSYKEKLYKDHARMEAALKTACDQMHALREQEAEKLSLQMIQALADLNFLHADFKIEVEEDAMTKEGTDQVSFMISTNPGEKRKPLAQVASGGELSRIMLALKTVLANEDQIDTLIFDEIDTGISGKTAWMVSEKMGGLSNDHQIICITHLPQIAAMANSHFLIEKSVEDGVTTTGIKKLSETESIEELSRMLGSDEITDVVRENAREMKAMATRGRISYRV